MLIRVIYSARPGLSLLLITTLIQRQGQPRPGTIDNEEQHCRSLYVRDCPRHWCSFPINIKAT